MIQNRLTLVAALLVPALLSSHVPLDRIHFAPSEGSSAKKTFENKAEFTLDHLSLSMNGQESPMQPEMEMTLNSTQKVVVTDEYLANRDGAPKKLRRSFDELANGITMAMKMEMMGQTQNHDQDIKGESELEGKKVVFTWDEEKGEYTRAFESADGKETLLKDLDEDMDLRALLPKSEVKEGEEWDIEVASLASVLAPGGNLSILPKDMEADQMAMGMPGMGSMSDWLRGSMEGSAKGHLTAIKEVDGAKMAFIKVNAKITVSKDMTEIVEEAMKNTKLPPEAGAMEVDHMDIDYKFEGEGELVWDLAAGHAHAFTFSGPSNLNMDMAMKLEAQGQNMSIEYGMEMSGTTGFTVEVE
jgi:hypothetical protein